MKITDVKNVLVIYHREDNDGVCSAAIVSQFLKVYGNPEVNVKFFGCHYGELSTLWKEYQDAVTTGDKETIAKTKMAKWVSKFDQIYMVDISFNEADAMEYLYNSRPDGDFIWCDHHHPIIEFSLTNKDKYQFGITPGVRRTDQSALANTWEYMAAVTNVDIQPSHALVMLSDYDSWSWTRKEEYAGDNKDRLFALNTGFTRRSNLKVKWFENYIFNVLQNNVSGMRVSEEDCLQYGSIILEYDRERNTRDINSHGDTSWTIGGEKACAIFTIDRLNSQSFTRVFAGTDIEHGLVFKREHDGSWTLSAYNVSEESGFDCGAYLKANYGGGGHRGAAGCTLTQDQLIGMLTSHQV